MTLYYWPRGRHNLAIEQQQQKKINLKSPHHQKKKNSVALSQLQRLTGLTIVIILQYIQILNQYVINLMFTCIIMLHVNYISIKNKYNEKKKIFLNTYE